MEFINAFTIDVEEHFQVSAFEATVSREQWDGFPSRVVANTRRLLALLDCHGVKATFFVLGWTAKRHPALVREIEAAGHEIASHGFWHRIVYDQSPQEFREDIRLGRDVLQDIVGRRVTAYRAPSFSITRRSLWARQILVEEGFEVDSSVFPVHHDRYGIPDAPLHIHHVETPAGPLWEFPPSVARVGGMRLPVGGGGYFRLYPLRWTTALLRRIHRFDRRPFLFYMHPGRSIPTSRGSRPNRGFHASGTTSICRARKPNFRRCSITFVSRPWAKSSVRSGRVQPAAGIQPSSLPQ